MTECLKKKSAIDEAGNGEGCSWLIGFRETKQQEACSRNPKDTAKLEPRGRGWWMAEESDCGATSV